LSFWKLVRFGAAEGGVGSAVLMMDFGTCWCRIWVSVPPELVWWWRICGCRSVFWSQGVLDGVWWRRRFRLSVNATDRRWGAR
jgi:hypothetical protein